MLSRVAENVYWLSRYLERIQNTARMINVHDRLLMDLPDVHPHDAWMPLISISGLNTQYLEHFTRANETNVTSFLIADTRNPGSLVNASVAIKNNLRSSRDIFPKVLYQKISSLVRYIRQETEQEIKKANRRDFLDTIERQLLEISGAVHASLRHDQAYRFMRMASYLERADMTSRVLDTPSTLLSTDQQQSGILPFENRDWAAALKAVSAMQMYRRHVRQPVSATGCLNFLLNDDQLPAACCFCLLRLDRCLENFKHNDVARTEVKQLMEYLASADITHLASDASARHNYLDQFQLGLINVGNAIATTYFPPVQEPA